MQLKDIADMETYLAERCYCPGEIYDRSGFFFQIFKADEECKLVATGKSRNSDESVTCVICRDQLINFWIDNNNVIQAAERYDATENNIKVMKDFWEGKDVVISLDEFENGSTKRQLEDILKYADAILVTT